MRLTDGQLDALRNLSRKQAGLHVGWIVIADARGLTELGFAARSRSGWQITASGASVLAHQEQGPPPRPAAPLVVLGARAGVGTLRGRQAGVGEGPTLYPA